MSDIKIEKSEVTFITDNEGNPSSLRLAFFCGIFMACILSLTLMYGKIFKNIPITMTDCMLILAWLMSAFGGKGLQKLAEMQGNKT